MVPAESVRVVDRKVLFDVFAAMQALSKAASTMSNNQVHDASFQANLKKLNQANALLNQVNAFLRDRTSFESTR